MKRTPLRPSAKGLQRKTPLRNAPHGHERELHPGLRSAQRLEPGLTRKVRLRAKGGERFKGRKNEAFRAWIRGLPCCVTGKFAVECAHVRTRGAGGGDVGNIVPLTPGLHRSQHILGIKSFQKLYNVDLAAIAADLGTRWLADHPEEAASA